MSNRSTLISIQTLGFHVSCLLASRVGPQTATLSVSAQAAVATAIEEQVHRMVAAIESAVLIYDTTHEPAAVGMVIGDEIHLVCTVAAIEEYARLKELLAPGAPLAVSATSTVTHLRWKEESAAVARSRFNRLCRGMGKVTSGLLSTTEYIDEP